MTALLDQPAIEEREPSARRPRQPRQSREPFSPVPFKESPPAHRPGPRTSHQEPTLLPGDEDQELLKSAPPVEPPAPEPARPACDKATLLADADRESWILQNTLFPTNLMYALSLDDPSKLLAVGLFLERFRVEAGATEDSLERLLLDQVYLTHLEIGRFHALERLTVA